MSVDSKSKRAGLRFIAAGELADQIGPTDWQIRHVLEANTLATVHAPPDTLKSFLVLDWGLSSAAGIDWHGHHAKAGPVLALIGEGRNGYMRRIRAWCLHREIGVDALPFFISNTSAALTDSVGRAELEAVIADFIQTHGAPVLVVIDTLARNFGPGDENSTRDMGAAIETCATIRDMTGAAVVLVHHSGKDITKGSRGSIALPGAVDAEYAMVREPDGTVRLECRKMKDAAKPQPMTFRFQTVDLGITDDEGEPVTSGVLVETDAPPRMATASDRREQIRALKQQGKTVSQVADITGIPRGTVGRHFTAINREADDYRDAAGGA